MRRSLVHPVHIALEDDGAVLEDDEAVGEIVVEELTDVDLAARRRGRAAQGMQPFGDPVRARTRRSLIPR